MKKISVLLVCVMLLTVFVGCGSNEVRESSLAEELNESLVSENGTESSEISEEIKIESYFAEVIQLKKQKIYCIDNAKQLYDFAMLVNSGKCDFDGDIVLLREDITLNEGDADSFIKAPPENVWEPIGTEAHPFRGSFVGGTADEDGYTEASRSISGIYCPAKNKIAGLFGYIKGASLQYITLGRGCVIIPEGEIGAAGGFAVEAYNSAIRFCVNNADVYGAEVAGIVNRSRKSTVWFCDNYGFVSGREAAGIAGIISGSMIRNCANYGKIVGSSDAGGIICGNISHASSINCCANYGDIEGKSCAGGIAASIWEEQSVLTIFNVFNAGSIKSEKYVPEEESPSGVSYGGSGGIVGRAVVLAIDGVGNFHLNGAVNIGKVEGVGEVGAIVGNEKRVKSEGVVVNCYYLNSTAEKGDIGIAVSADELSDSDSFGGLDMGSVWYIDEQNGYPVLFHCH